MEETELLKILEAQLAGKYYSSRELIYGTDPGFFLSPFAYQKFLEFKEEYVLSGGKGAKRLPLKSFNSECLYYFRGFELNSALQTYQDLARSGPAFSPRFLQSFLESRIYSEIEGSVNVENVPTTRRRLKELLEENAPATNRNDIIIKNMKAAIDFVNGLPEFNDENLFRLYSLLSDGCLDKEDELRPGEHYRYDSVEVDAYQGCPAEKIQECMDSLFAYVRDSLKDPHGKTLLPHICHYYLIYVHPYFDHNGRSARMVSYWIHLLAGSDAFPPIFSEAINQTKNKYYQAIELSRDSHNDLTYFLNYLLQVGSDYLLCYQNLEEVEKKAKRGGHILSETELNYAKRILISYEAPFVYTDFLQMAKVDMSKQGALKILNKFVEYGFLKEVPTKSKSKLFAIDGSSVPYALKHFGFRGKREKGN